MGHPTKYSLAKKPSPPLPRLFANYVGIHHRDLVCVAAVRHFPASVETASFDGAAVRSKWRISRVPCRSIRHNTKVYATMTYFPNCTRQCVVHGRDTSVLTSPLRECERERARALSARDWQLHFEEFFSGLTRLWMDGFLRHAPLPSAHRLPPYPTHSFSSLSISNNSFLGLRDFNSAPVG